jgi:hypothetical protein
MTTVPHRVRHYPVTGANLRHYPVMGAKLRPRDALNNEPHGAN